MNSKLALALCLLLCEVLINLEQLLGTKHKMLFYTPWKHEANVLWPCLVTLNSKKKYDQLIRTCYYSCLSFNTTSIFQWWMCTGMSEQSVNSFNSFVVLCFNYWWKMIHTVLFRLYSSIEYILTYVITCRVKQEVELCVISLG